MIGLRMAVLAGVFVGLAAWGQSTTDQQAQRPSEGAQQTAMGGVNLEA